MTDTLEQAKRYHALGWNAVAAPTRSKSPAGSWKRWQEERVPLRHLEESFRFGAHNIFVITGAVSRLVVLDTDDRDAVKYWFGELGEPLKETARASTGKGFHFYFGLPPGVRVRGRSGPNWDLRADGGGVIAPPSTHPSGRAYEWVIPPEQSLLEAPAALLEAAAAPDDEGAARSRLTDLLANPAAEGGRNMWLAQVAGHYAAMTRFQDAYEWHVREAAARLEPPLPEEEIAKLLRSIWDKEMIKLRSEREGIPEAWVGDNWQKWLKIPAEDNGYLVSNDAQILIRCRKRVKDGEGEDTLRPWMDGDLRVQSVVVSGDERSYHVEVRRLRGQATFEDSLPARAVADPRQLTVWLANRGMTIADPDGPERPYPRMRANERLVRYLEAQGAPSARGVPALGWHGEAGGFLTHEEVIGPHARAPFGLYRPDPGIRAWAPYRYGFAAEDAARSVLAEVLTFHDETVAAVFGSWWAACLLKPQVMQVSSQFPFMALEAASESGKTTGFFAMMLQLAGNTSAQTNPTRAALRDYLSAHNNGIVWVDDLDSLHAHGELLRNVTVGGALAKKGEGNHAQVVAVMRSALVVSGESLGLHDQKALLDRAVLLDVPSPIGRRSLRGGHAQWDDIVEFRRQHPDLTEYAGTLVQLALSWIERAHELRRLRAGRGRFADKVAVVRWGARLLSHLAHAGWVADVVDRWAEGQHDPGAENTLTLRLIPRALERTGWLAKPQGPDPSRRIGITPAFVTAALNDDPETVWFSPQLLADWWEKERHGRVDTRVESAEALTQQAHALGLGGKRGRRGFRLVTGEGNRIYWRLTPELTQAVLARSRSEGGINGED